MTTKRVSLADQVREAVDASGMSHLAVGRAADIDKGLFCRFMKGRSGLSVPSLNRLADVLNLNIVVGRRTTPRKARTR